MTQTSAANRRPVTHIGVLNGPDLNRLCARQPHIVNQAGLGRRGYRVALEYLCE